MLARAMPAKARSAGRALRLPALAAGLLLAAAAAAAGVAGVAGWLWVGAPRVWRAGEVPVAFWAWRAEAPSESEVEAARRETGARTLFMRAGQLDYEGGRVERVRAVTGKFPRTVELHLVYNATPALLSAFGRVGEDDVASAVAAAFARDARRGADDGATIAGLQLDLDVPTRLLPRYGRVLASVRGRLPAGTRLSVTGLPTWMGSAELAGALAAADFWAPQFYGSEIPRRLTEAVPVSSPRRVARDAARASALGKPFYAGLAAYGYAGLYSERGELRALRGDLAPEDAARHASLELVERRPFAARADDGRGGGGSEGAGGAKAEGAAAGGWRYVFRAREAAVVSGTSVAEGESLVFYSTGGEGLRAAARAVRKNAGAALVGVCVFRLPSGEDRTTLGLAQVAAALADRAAEVSTIVRAARPSSAGAESAKQLELTAINDGAVGAHVGDGALTLTLRVRPGSLRGVASLEGFDAVETLCESGAAPARPCGPRRAGLLRLGARSWPAGASARVGLSFEGEPPASLEMHVRVRAEDGRAFARAEVVRASPRTVRLRGR
ncbi:MAG TPA: DUF3142 domain-containing protein [Pyrinomonadaceae bacterium]|nr:DUF3142 domain-containing protein [Pyrinomonadaceae bacterium]